MRKLLITICLIFCMFSQTQVNTISEAIAKDNVACIQLDFDDDDMPEFINL